MAKILIADDSIILRAQLKSDLLAEEHEVLEAADPCTCIEIIKNTKDIQLIIADYIMPNMDGITMCSKIKEIEGTENIVIFILSSQMNVDKTRGKQVGVKAWITKPYKSSSLLAVINKLFPQ